ncbi:MAG: hypothetical protein IRZ33_06985 [Alicyclobacillaceae bacterium]|nr:hypothetical protein [Alicyclobacillaceae bacterium]
MNVPVTTHELVLALVIGIPAAFALGRMSHRVTWFRAQAEQKYSLPEFMRGER